MGVSEERALLGASGSGCSLPVRDYYTPEGPWNVDHATVKGLRSSRSPIESSTAHIYHPLCYISYPTHSHNQLLKLFIFFCPKKKIIPPTIV